MQEIKFINRTTTNIETEKVPAGGTLKFLYGSVFGKISLTLLVKRKGLSALAGSYMNSKASIKKIVPFIKEYGINMDDFISPKNGFKHFNDFFYLIHSIVNVRNIEVFIQTHQQHPRHAHLLQQVLMKEK